MIPVGGEGSTLVHMQHIAILREVQLGCYGLAQIPPKEVRGVFPVYHHHLNGRIERAKRLFYMQTGDVITGIINVDSKEYSHLREKYSQQFADAEES